MGIKNLLPLHKKEESGSSTEPREHHHHHHHERTNGHIAVRTKKPKQHSFISNKWRNELVAAAAEFCGTFMFLFFAFGGTQVANTAALYSDQATAGQQNDSITQAPNSSVLLYISLIFGFSLMVNVWVFFRVSGGLFNPAVTFGLWLINALKTDRAILCFISQMIAGICAAAVISAILPGDLNVSTTLGSGVSAAQGVFLEMFLTSLLVITIFMLAAEKHKATFLAPIGIGLSLFVAEMVGVFFTGGSLNPTRSFGPCVVTRNFPDYHYIYWFGPAMGTLLAFGVYKIIKSVEYETVNPGQDFDDHEAAAFNPPDDPDSAEQVERPNVAAIAARDAVRRLASNSTDEKEQETSSVNGDGAAANSGGIDTRMWRDQHEAHRSGGFERGTSQDQIERRRSSRETRTTRDQMAFDAEMLSRSGHGSMKRGPSSDAWV